MKNCGERDTTKRIARKQRWNLKDRIRKREKIFKFKPETRTRKFSFYGEIERESSRIDLDREKTRKESYVSSFLIFLFFCCRFLETHRLMIFLFCTWLQYFSGRGTFSLTLLVKRNNLIIFHFRYALFQTKTLPVLFLLTSKENFKTSKIYLALNKQWKHIK